jgi:hypothetical protein
MAGSVFRCQPFAVSDNGKKITCIPVVTPLGNTGQKQISMWSADAWLINTLVTTSRNTDGLLIYREKTSP